MLAAMPIARSELAPRRERDWEAGDALPWNSLDQV
jgi:hypothetical protein